MATSVKTQYNLPPNGLNDVVGTAFHQRSKSPIHCQIPYQNLKLTLSDPIEKPIYDSSDDEDDDENEMLLELKEIIKRGKNELEPSIHDSRDEGNAVLCGLRNGAVVTVDLRQSPRQLPRHRIPYPSHGIREPCSRKVQKITQPWFLIKLYDHRLTKRGPLQSYEGHVNSHTRIQLGIDPCERFVVSGNGRVSC